MKNHMKRPADALVGMAVFLLVSALLALLLGSSSLSASQVIRDGLAGRFQSLSWRIFYYVRLPRVLGAVLCGSGLAVSGAVLQAVLNNSLAGPGTIGVNAGAGFAALLVMALFPVHTALLPAASFAGALLCTLLIYGVARTTGASRMTIVLAGVAVSSVINAASSALKTLFPDVLAAYNSFSVGTLNGVQLPQLKAALPYLAVGLLGALLLSGDMNVLALGEETARSLGLNVERCRMLLILTAAVLAGASVSFCGLVGFVGLLVPHAARLLLGADNRLVVAASALLGGASVVLCDLLGRILFAPFELPVGVVLALVGGAGFLVLLFHRKGGGKLYA